MDDLMRKTGDNAEKDILYSRTIKAGKRIYYLDIKQNHKGDLYLAITESKKVQPRNATNATFEKHKIFLYQEDFTKFQNELENVMHFVQVFDQNVEGEEKVGVDADQEENDLQM